MKWIGFLQVYFIIALYAVSSFTMDHPQLQRFFTEPFVQADDDLFDAVSVGSYEDFLPALIAGANVNRAQPDGNTPLHILASGSFHVVHSNETYSLPSQTYRTARGVGMVVALWKDGANPFIRNGQGLTPLEILNARLARGGEPESRHYLLIMRGMLQLAEQWQINNQLIDAVYKGRVEVIKELLEQEEIHPNDAMTIEGIPMFSLAANHIDPATAEEMVRILIPAIIDLNPPYGGQRLLDRLRHRPDRQGVINLIEEEMRARNPVAAPVSYLSSPLGWIGSLWGGASS